MRGTTNFMKNLFAIFTFLFFSTSSFCQSSIETDRPDQTETSFIVPKNKFQAETGIKHEKTDKGENEYTLPTSLLKFGLSEILELRVILEFGYSETEKGIESGLKPVIVGTKVKLFDEKGIVPAASLLAQFQLPKVASSDFKAAHLAPEFRLLMQNKLSDASDLGYNVGAEWDGLSCQPEYIFTISPNYDITKKLKAFVETYGFLQSRHHAEQWVDGGFSYLLSDNMKLDISGGYELTHTSNYHNFFESIGFSFRI